MPLVFNNQEKNQTNIKQQFLPDFCGLTIVFAVVIIGELFAIILTISSSGFTLRSWDSLALSSLYIQWNGLLSIAFLCLLRRFVSSYNRYLIASFSYLGLLFLFLLISEISYNLVIYMDMQQLMAVGNRFDYHLRNLIIGGIISGIVLRYFYVQHQWKLKTEAVSRSHLQLLQARIRPHFLFNSMNTIASLTRSDPELAEQVTIDLADLFRILFQQEQSLVSWAKELQISRQYLDIESLRLADRLKVHWDIQDIPDNMLLPVLTLQPLLENAIYHGIEPSIDGGKIHISAKKNNQQIRITITNSQAILSSKRLGNKMAVDNIRQRLMACFAKEASLELKESNKEFKVILVFPFKTT